MKKSKLLLSTLLFGGLFLVGCSNSTPTTTSSSEPSTSSSSSSSSSTAKTITYKLKVIDLDGEVLVNKDVEAKEGESLFLNLNSDQSLKLVADAGDYGHFITSIAGSIVDSGSYALSLYKNNEYSMVGVDDVKLAQGDEIVFKNECWNTIGNGYGGIKSETDIKVDKIIYSSYKNLKEYYKDFDYIPYDLAFAFSKLEKLDYDIDAKNIYPDTIKANYENFNTYNTLTLGDAFKTAITLYALDKDLTGIKSHIQASSYEFSDTSNTTQAVFMDDVMSILGVQASNMSAYSELISNLTLSANETSCMYVTAMSAIENYNFDSFIDGIKNSLTEDGFSYSMSWGENIYVTCNASSTSQAILALTTLGKNLNSDEFKVNGESLIDILLKYYDEETNQFYDYEGDTYNLGYAEAQSLSALISYKILSEKSSVNIYRG